MQALDFVGYGKSPYPLDQQWTTLAGLGWLAWAGWLGLAGWPAGAGMNEYTSYAHRSLTWLAG